MDIKPTKTWLKEHPPMKLCPWKDTGCHCAFTLLDEDEPNGFCIGLIPDAPDLDFIRLCGNLPDNASTNVNIFRVLVQFTPAEAAWLGIHISIGLASVFQADPEYRKAMGEMRRRKKRATNKRTMLT